MSVDTLPDKRYFRIGEAARLVGVKPYVLRYWETEFAVLRPGKTRARHRLYRREDVETLREIRRLLHTERYTIEGARRRLREAGRRREERAGATPAPSIDLTEVRDELLALHRLLADEPAALPSRLAIEPPGDTRAGHAAGKAGAANVEDSG